MWSAPLKGLCDSLTPPPCCSSFFPLPGLWAAELSPSFFSAGAQAPGPQPQSIRVCLFLCFTSFPARVGAPRTLKGPAEEGLGETLLTQFLPGFCSVPRSRGREKGGVGSLCSPI